MKYETIKSWILIFLVLLSLLLYYLLWTDQGSNFETLTNSPTMEQERIGSTKEISQVVKPDRIYQHIQGMHYGTSSINEINEVIKQLRDNEFGRLENISPEITNVATFLSEKTNSMEIRFPGNVTLGVYKEVLPLEGNEEFEFDTILLSYSVDNNGEGEVYFISRSNQIVYQGKLTSSFMTKFQSFQENVGGEETVYVPHFPYQLNEQQLIYLPSNQSTVKKYKYLSRRIDSIRLKRALFTDPSIAQKEIYTNREEYTDDSGLLRIYKDTHIVSFFKPSGIPINEAGQNQIIRNSIQMINQRGGWTNNYLYVGKEGNQKLYFRMYNTTGLPIFNLTTKISDIQVVWENNRVKQYITNNISMTSPFDSAIDTVPSGYEVVDYLKNTRNIDMSQLQDIVIGYDMKMDYQNIVSLTPTWFYKLNNTWNMAYLGDEGGKLDGLE